MALLYGRTGRLTAPNGGFRRWQGKNMLQVWELPTVQLEAASAAGQRPAAADGREPRLLFGIAHDGGIAWDCKWCQAPGARHAGRLGLLAAGLGDGQLVVYAVPEPAAVVAAAGEQACVALAPVYRAAVDGKLLWTVAWAPAADRLVTGCPDGSVFVWAVAAAAEARTAYAEDPCRTPLLCFAARCGSVFHNAADAMPCVRPDTEVCACPARRQSGRCAGRPQMWVASTLWSPLPTTAPSGSGTSGTPGSLK